jgi:hypothetical protein
LLNFVLIGVVSGLGAVLFHLLCEGGNFLGHAGRLPSACASR